MEVTIDKISNWYTVWFMDELSWEDWPEQVKRIVVVEDVEIEDMTQGNSFQMEHNQDHKTFWKLVAVLEELFHIGYDKYSKVNFTVKYEEWHCVEEES